MEITNQKNDNYIVSVYSTQAKNKLERLLDETFRQLDYCIIDIADVDKLQQVYEKAVNLYKSTKGKCNTTFRMSHPFHSTYYIEIGDFMTINLQKIKGTLTA